MCSTDFGDHRERATTLPAFAPVQQLCLEPALQVALAFHRGDRAGLLAEQYGGQCRTQAAFIGRLQQGQQQRTKIARFRGGKQALLAGRHRRNAHRGQRALYQGGLAMRTHQHRDVARLHRSPTQHGVAGTRSNQGLVDRCHTGLGGGIARGIGAHRLVAATAQHAQGQRDGGTTIAQVILVNPHAAGPHRLELDVAFEESVFAAVVIQRLQRTQHGRSRAEVLVQHRCLLRHLLGLQVGVDITAAEAIDRLLGVTDQEQRRRQAEFAHLRRIAEHGVEDAPLAVVGILELIDQRDAVLRAQLLHQCQPLRAFQRQRHAIDQIVVGLHPASALQCLQPLRGVGAKRVQEIQRGGTQPGIAFGQQRDIARQRRLQRRRWRALGELLVGLGGQCLGQQRWQALIGQQLARVGALGPGQQLPAQRVQPPQLVGHAVDPLVVDRIAEVDEELLAMRAHACGQCFRRALQGRMRIGQRHRLRQRMQRRCGQQRAQIGGQRVRGGPQPGQRFQRGRVVGMHTPQVGRQLLQQLTVTGQQFRRVEGVAALQRMLAQHAGAEAVDGEDGGQVDLVRGHLQAPLQCGGTLGAALQMALQDFAGQAYIRRFTLGRFQIDQACRQRQALADALAQFLGGSVGEGHCQDLADAQALLHHQAGEQRGQGEGLAGAGAGFDQSNAIQRQGQVGIAAEELDAVPDDHGAHALPSWRDSVPRVRPSRTALKTTWLLRSRSA